MGLLTGVLSLAREPARATLKVWEFGLATAASAARLGLDLLDPSPPRPSEYRAPPEVQPEPPPPTTRDAPPPPRDAPPPVPDELVPDHVDEEPVLVAEAAEPGAEDGAGPEVEIDEPWEGYRGMTAADIRDRLAVATPEEAGAVKLYEAAGRGRTSVLEAADRAMRAL